MNTNRRQALVALCAAGLLWGATVPLSKLALEWLPAGWLTVARFGLAAALLLAFTRRGLRTAVTPRVLIYGAIGYGGTVIIQNAGITRTSVTHAALMIGAVPVLVAVISAVWLRAVARPVAWAGFAVSLAGVALVTGGGGGGATPRGDALVLASLLLSATFTVAQARLLTGRDPIAVTAGEFLGAALGALAFTLVTEGVPSRPAGLAPVLAVLALAVCGTLLPFTLFAFGQSRVSSEVAGAFLNLEPLVGAVAGAAFFGDPAGAGLLFGGAAILVGIGLSTLTLLRNAEPTGGDPADRYRPGTAGVTPDAWSPGGELGVARAGVVRLRIADVFRPPDIVAIIRGPMWSARGWNHSPFGI
ncbi:MAG TPA: DMT family transporter [Streptosporangiaceae bacterium]|nr:DMT family transporter [Streptosporangiaceae bacterium]